VLCTEKVPHSDYKSNYCITVLVVLAYSNGMNNTGSVMLENIMEKGAKQYEGHNSQVTCGMRTEQWVKMHDADVDKTLTLTLTRVVNG